MTRRPTSAPRPSPRGGSAVRRTLVPLLLTGGLISIGLAVGWWSTEADSPYRRVGMGLPITLALSGIILMFAAAANMVFIRRGMSSAASRRQRPN